MHDIKCHIVLLSNYCQNCCLNLVLKGLKSIMLDFKGANSQKEKGLDNHQFTYEILECRSNITKRMWRYYIHIRKLSIFRECMKDEVMWKLKHLAPRWNIFFSMNILISKLFYHFLSSKTKNCFLWSILQPIMKSNYHQPINWSGAK